MRRLLFTIAALIVIAAVTPAVHAQVFYAHPGARPTPDDSPAMGAAVGFGDNMFRLVGFVRVNASQSSDLGFEIVYDDFDTGPGSDDSGLFGGGLDWRLRVVEQDDDQRPVDAAVQIGAGIQVESDYTLYRFPIGAMGSRTFVLSDGREVTPYLGAYLVIDVIDIDALGTDSDTDVEIRVGGSVDLVKRAKFFTALHAGNGTIFFLGFTVGL